MRKLKFMTIWSLILFSVFTGLSASFQYIQTEDLSDAVENVNKVVPALNKEIKSTNEVLRKGFLNPPESARPGVYWYFMDGNISKEAITADLESMKKVGVGHVLFLEVNVGVPRGKVDFMSEEWMDLFTYMVRESERLGIIVSLGVGPGWNGSGGPWVTGAQSMKHLVHSTVKVEGNENRKIILSKAAPMKPYFGEGAFTPELKKRWLEYYEDVVVLAFPTPNDDVKINDIYEKALYYRDPYSSMPGVKAFIPSYAEYLEPIQGAVISSDKIIDVTRFLKSDSVLEWKVPDGNWTIMRFGCTNNGCVTRPAPLPGVGFESDKCDTTAINAHLASFTSKLLKRTGTPDKNQKGGLKMLHIDSWEVGAQNWTAKLREEFTKRRGYDPQPFFPVYAGLIVESLEKSERFLWDLRQTFQELVIENNAIYLKKYGQKYNLGISIEPYDLNPTADLELGAVADVPMCEFWSKDFGFNTSYSCIEAASIAHIEGKKVVAAEAFTGHLDAWKQYPGSMKNQGDWAFAAGINKFMYHTFQHQSLPENLKPGMTMGPYGVHHDRSQTWWSMADAYHKYVARCQYMLQQGAPVADILYLTPEGAPQVFRAPASALTKAENLTSSLSFTVKDEIIPGQAKEDFLPDRKGYNFDGCSPSQILKASVRNGKIIFPSGASYSLLVLPKTETMTPALLNKIEMLIKAGATVIGNPPRKSPSLVNYPECDSQVSNLATKMWGELTAPSEITKRKLGKGTIYWSGAYSEMKSPELYPDYYSTASLLREMGIQEDFMSTGPVRYTHQQIESGDVYFVSNKTNFTINTNCLFRVKKGTPELWNAMTGETRELNDYVVRNGQIQIPLQFEPYESYFIVFNKNGKTKKGNSPININFSEPVVLSEISKPWKVSFDPKWGGLENVTFDKLEDWTTRPEEGIKYYSGIATYHTDIEINEKIMADKKSDIFIDLGEVNNLARVRVNGKDMGVVWAAPFRLKISDAVVVGENNIDIEVVNLWPNRLIGDEQKPDDGIVNGQWPEWLQKGTARTSGRFTFTTFKHYNKDSKLLKSGLMGPVKILTIKK
ncbi:MAG: glycosyl hydrolase [Paludibacter sp.]|nr:glycosyl hydrolase [Paludibacter sp.]